MVRCAPSDALRAASLHLAAFSSYFSNLVWRSPSIAQLPTQNQRQRGRSAGRKNGHYGEILRKRCAAVATALRVSGQDGTGLRALPDHRIDEALARIGMALPARFQHMAEQEQAGELEAVLRVLIRPAGLSLLALTQEWREAKQPVAPGLAGRARHRTAGFRRDIDEIGGLAGRGAVFQVEAEAELTEHRKLEPDQMHRRTAGVVEI